MIRLIAFLFVATSTFAGTYQPHDPRTVPGFIDFYNNEYDKAYIYFKDELNAHPKSADAHNHLAQVVLYRELFRDGALESQLVSGSNPFLRSPKLNISPRTKAEFNRCIDRSIKLNEQALAKNPNDIHALYSEGAAHGLRANYSFLVEKAWTDSLSDASAANKLNKKVLAIDPAFVDARLVVGLYEYVVGNLPFYMRILGVVGGFHGDKKDGIQQIQQVAKYGTLNKYDAEILLAVIYRREHKLALALPLLKEAANQFPRNYLFQLEQVQMYSDLGKKREALQVLDNVDRLRREDAPGYDTLRAEKLTYLRGNLLFWYGDLDQALTALQQVSQTTSGSDVDALDLNTALMTWLRLGQTYDLKKDHAKAVRAYRKVVDTAPHSELADEASGYIDDPYHQKKQKS